MEARETIRDAQEEEKVDKERFADQLRRKLLHGIDQASVLMQTALQQASQDVFSPQPAHGQEAEAASSHGGALEPVGQELGRFNGALLGAMVGDSLAASSDGFQNQRAL